MRNDTNGAQICASQVVKQVELAYAGFLQNADSASLLHLARGRGVGLKIYGLSAPEIYLTVGSLGFPSINDDVDFYLDCPIHSLPIENELSEFDYLGCIAWLQDNGIDSHSLDSFELDCKSSSELFRRFEESIFAIEEVRGTLRLEMLGEIDDIVFEFGVGFEALIE